MSRYDPDRVPEKTNKAANRAVSWVKEHLSARPLNQDEPSLKRFRALGMVSPARIEEAVKAEFGDPRVKGRAG